MQKDYKILVHMRPNLHDSPAAPHFWCILESSGRSSANAGSGWAATPEQAFLDAKAYMERIQDPKQE